MFGLFGRAGAIRRLIRTLARRLYADYGASEFFTPQQIQTALAKLKIDTRLSAYAYAMFLPEAEYMRLPIEVGEQVSYEQARNEIAQRTIPKAQKLGYLLGLDLSGWSGGSWVNGSSGDWGGGDSSGSGACHSDGGGGGDCAH